jgi:hypothetical protein
MFGPVDFLILGVTALIHFIFGALWFGVIFGKKWQELMDISEEKMVVMKSRQLLSMILSLIGSVLLVYAASRMIIVTNPTGLIDVILLAVLCWSGFLLIKSLQVVGYEGQPWMLFLIDTAYYFVGFILVFVILFYWR